MKDDDEQLYQQFNRLYSIDGKCARIQVYENVTGVKPTTEQAAPFIEQLKDGSHTPESLALMAADINASATQNIDFAGILQHGLQYLPVL